MKKFIKFMKEIILPLIFLAAVLYSCKQAVPTMISFIPPENAELKVRDIRVKGFTLEWTEPGVNDCEYAIAVSYDGNIENYETALAHDNIVLDFTPDYMLDGTYKITGLLPGREHKIKLFVRSRNIEVSEYLTGSAVLPYLDDAELVNVWINGGETIYNKTDDSYTYYYFLGQQSHEYILTYRLLHGCVLYVNGEKTDEKEIKIEPDEPFHVTAYHERTHASRDYIIYIRGRNNGIPLIIIDTEDKRQITRRRAGNDIPAYMRIIDSEHNPLNIGLYEGEIKIRGRGNSSWGMPKKGYNLQLPVRTQIFDMAPSKSWMLSANYSDKSLMRNYTAYEFSRDLGAAFAAKNRFADLILNGDYIGTYTIGERIKVAPGRLDLPEIKFDTADEYDLTGTYILEVNSMDKYDADEIIFMTNTVRNSHFWSIKQPGSDNLPEAAYEYIQDYIFKVEEALFGDNFKDPVTGYRAYLDTKSFIDWYLVNELYKNVDSGFHTSVYFYKPRGGKLHMGPVWDFDLGAGNADYNGCDNPERWYVRNSAWFTRLFQDEAFAREFRDRWNYVNNSGYFERFFKRIDDTADIIARSAELNFRRWDILGRYVWPNAGDVSQRTTYQSEIDYLKDWLRQRIEWMDREINR